MAFIWDLLIDGGNFLDFSSFAALLLKHIFCIVSVLRKRSLLIKTRTMQRTRFQSRAR